MLAAGCGAGGGCSSGPPPVPPSPRALTFNCQSLPQIWQVPSDVSVVTIDLYGAQGGDSTSPGGLGGQTKLVWPVTPGSSIGFKVGCAGQNAANAAGGTGGLGDGVGGDGGNATVSGAPDGGGGGGGTSVAFDPFSVNFFVPALAGGGGGGSLTSGGNGGGGAGTPAAAATDPLTCSTGSGGQPGTQSSGGPASATDAVCTTAGGAGDPLFIGDGGAGVNGTAAGSGGGGGGNHGGGGGSAGLSGAGGGSGFCFLGCVLQLGGVHAGDGKVVVSFSSVFAASSAGTSRAASTGWHPNGPRRSP